MLQSFVKKYGLYFVVVVAFFMVFWRLGSLPVGIFPDESGNAIAAQTVWTDGPKVFYDAEGCCKAGLYLWLLSVPVELLPPSAFVLRLLPALFGVATALFAYLSARRIAGSYAALLTGILVATEPWHLHVSRIGFRISMMLFFISIATWAILRAFETNTYRRWAFAGVTLGAGFYSYFAWPAFAGMVFIAGLWYLISEKITPVPYKQIAVGAVCGLLVLSPLLKFAIQHPDTYFSRATSLAESNEGSVLGEAFESSITSTKALGGTGDMNARHNDPGSPHVSLFAWLGAIVAIVLAMVNVVDRRLATVLVIATAVLHGPAIASASEVPHAFRSSGAMMPLLLLSGIGWIRLVQWVGRFAASKRFMPALWIKNIATSTVMVSVVAVSITNYYSFFHVWGESPRLYDGFTQQLTVAVEHLKANPNREAAVYTDGFHKLNVDYLLGPDAYQHLDSFRVDASDIEGVGVVYVDERYEQDWLKILGLNLRDWQTERLVGSEHTWHREFVLYTYAPRAAVSQ